MIVHDKWSVDALWTAAQEIEELAKTKISTTVSATLYKMVFTGRTTYGMRVKIAKYPEQSTFTEFLTESVAVYEYLRAVATALIKDPDRLDDPMPAGDALLKQLFGK
jgi:hypothetical protein